MAAQPTPQELAALQTRIDANPGIRAAWRTYQAAGSSSASMRTYLSAVAAALAAAGITLPHDYRVGPAGQITKKDVYGRNPWLGPALSFGGVIGGGLAHGALAGGSTAPGILGGASTVPLETFPGSDPNVPNIPNGPNVPNIPNVPNNIWESLLGAGATGGLAALLSQLNKQNEKPALTPQQQAQMDEMMGLSVDRQRRIAPVHEAAMRMAQSMAPTGGSSPRLEQARLSATRPRPQTQSSPEMLRAIQALMRR